MQIRPSLWQRDDSVGDSQLSQVRKLPVMEHWIDLPVYARIVFASLVVVYAVVYSDLAW